MECQCGDWASKNFRTCGLRKDRSCLALNENCFGWFGPVEVTGKSEWGIASWYVLWPFKEVLPGPSPSPTGMLAALSLGVRLTVDLVHLLVALGKWTGKKSLDSGQPSVVFSILTGVSLPVTWCWGARVHTESPEKCQDSIWAEPACHSKKANINWTSHLGRDSAMSIVSHQGTQILATDSVKMKPKVAGNDY